MDTKYSCNRRNGLVAPLFRHPSSHSHFRLSKSGEGYKTSMLTMPYVNPTID